jgi:hypothetical protein
MQFVIPQFIDIEDKIIGPFTFKQFMYLAGGAGLAFTVYKLLPVLISLPIAIGIVVLAIALTFYKVNGKPFVFTFQAFIYYMFQSKLYIWKKLPEKEIVNKKEIDQKTKVEETKIPRLTESKLGDLSWSLDILDMKEKGQ